ncbi:MAG TPA: universal stress protein [Candidatus Methanofastidiosa archaeon]|nr:universal stress protein [Candidatus Methanofastidiosa archaeon]
MEKIVNRILVPIDGSKTSYNAIKYASKLAKSSDAQIHLLNVIDTERMGPTDDETLYDLKVEHAKNILEEAEGIAMSYVLNVTKEITKGPVPETIVSVAKENGFDLIVMGTRGMSDYNNSMLGHVSEKVAKYAHCPVVLV